MVADSKRTGESLRRWIAEYARPMRCQPDKYIVDEFDTEFYLIFDLSDDETPEAKGTCDVLIAPLMSDDQLADAIRIKANADKYGVMRLLAALGIGRFNIKVQNAFYDANKILRKED